MPLILVDGDFCRTAAAEQDRPAVDAACIAAEKGEIGLSDDELFFRGGDYRIYLSHNYFFFRTKIMNYSINRSLLFRKVPTLFAIKGTSVPFLEYFCT